MDCSRSLVWIWRYPLCVLLALGLRVFAVSVEQDPEAAERAAHSFPNLVTMQYVEDFRGYMLRDILRRRTVEGVIVGGGSPCQGNFSLNRHRRGLRDVRSHQPSELARIVQEIQELPEAQGIKVTGPFLRTLQVLPVISSNSTMTSWRPNHYECRQLGSAGFSVIASSG